MCDETTFSSSTSSVLTISDIQKAIDVVNALPPEPFSQWMKEEGKSPDDGYELHLPVHVKQHFPNVPSYVKFSRAVHVPIIIQTFDISTFKL
mgnify:CR=1 FL=1